MTQRTISKVLIAQEDLALGQGSVNQTRQGLTVPVTKMDLPWVFTTILDLRQLDTTLYKHCILDSDEQILFYRYTADSAETVDDYLYIAPNVGSGQWKLVSQLRKREYDYDSVADFLLASPDSYTVNIIGYSDTYKTGTAAQKLAGPKGGHKRHQTGKTVSTTSVSNPATSTEGTAANGNAGYSWDGRGREWLISDEVVNPYMFSAVADGTTDDTAAMNNFRAFIASTLRKGHFYNGTYTYSTSPNWAIEKLHITFDGEVTLKCTGTGDALSFDAGASARLFDMTFGWGGNKPFVQGNASGGHGVYVQSCHHCKIGAKVTGCGSAKAALRVDFCVLGEFDIVASVNQQAWVAQPKYGIYLSRRGTLEDTSACVFYNPIIEGVSGSGIYLDWCLKNEFIGGTSEGNDGDNIEHTANSRNNTFLGIDLEVPDSGVGIRDAGRRNTYKDVLNDARTIFSVGSQCNRLDGGIYDEIITLGARAKLTDVEYGSNSGEIIQEYTGAHDGSANASVLVDTGAAFPVNSVTGVGDLVGLTITNDTDGSSATITANTATTVTGILNGGSDDDWDVSDAYTIIGDPTSTLKDCFDVASATFKQVNKTQGKKHFITVATVGAFGATLTSPGIITKTGIPLTGVELGDLVTGVNHTAQAAGFEGPTVRVTAKDTVSISFTQVTGSVVSPLPSGSDFTFRVNGA